MATKEEKPDETPTRLKHENGATVVVPAHKAEGLLRGGTFTKATARKTAASSKPE
jgi:hypothetical protein